MKAILSPDCLSVMSIVPDDTQTRPAVTRPVVDDGEQSPAFNRLTQYLATEYRIEPEAVFRSVTVAPLANRIPAWVEALEFSDRLTPEEWEGIEGMAAQYPAVRHALRRLTRATLVDVLDPDLPYLFGAAVAAGVLAPDRPAAILALPA